MPQKSNERPSLTSIQAALTFIPPNDRALWLKVGMALKVELGDTGFDVFDSWSQSGESYDLAAAKSSWKSFKTGGKISIGTLIYEAKQRGFNPKEHAPAAPITAEAAAQIAQERAQRLAADQAELERQQAQAASIAANAWGAASDSGQSAYLEKKRIAGHGVRFAANKAGAVLLVPVRDESGKLWNIQRVFANGDKRFYTGGRVSGCLHVLGDLPASDWLLIAEGYATGATLFEAAGYGVAIAFSESNIKHVAALMRARYPDKRILICADDDSQTEQKTGRNPGVVAATEAAKAVQGCWCKPVNLPEGGNDFNDLAQAMGMHEVKRQIEAAMQPAPAQLPAAPAENETAPNEIAVIAPPVNQIDAQAIISEPVKADKGSTEKTPAKPRQTSSRKPAGDGQASKPFFTNNDEGVFFHNFHEGEPLAALKICSSLDVIAKTRDAASNEWGYLLEFADPDGNKKRWSMPAKMLSGDGTQYRADLLSMGLLIEPGLKTKNYLTTYIQTREVPERVRCVERIGWHDYVYVLPDRTIGQGSEQVLFQTTGGVVSQFKQRGTLADWQGNVSAHCRGNSRLLLSVSAGFASLLIRHTGLDGFGLHLIGSSSIGKSTAVKVAASLFGAKDFIQSWNTTHNRLESTAKKFNDTLLILDELGQADPKMVGDIVYMIGNEQGKARMRQDAGDKPVAAFKVIALSTGETTVEAKMAEAGKIAKAGQEVRMVGISADAGKGLGMFDTVYGFADGAAMSKHLVSMAQQYYGTAGLAFIEWLIENMGDLPNILRTAVNATAAKMCPPNAHGQVIRVADFLSLIAVGGELATGAGITGWVDGEATKAATDCFNGWLFSRGTAGDIEHDRMLSLLPDFIRVNGDARFGWKHREMDDHAPKIINQAGFRRMVSKGGTPIDSNTAHGKEYGDKLHPDEASGATIEYFIDPKVFKDEVCKGYDARAVTAKLVTAGVFEIGKDGKTSQNFKYAGSQHRYYKVSSEKLSELQTQ